MVSLSQSFWVKTLVVFSLLTFVFGGVHIADEIINVEMSSAGVQTFVLVEVVVLTVRAFSTLWSWAGKRYGYIVLGLVSLFNFFGFFLLHVLLSNTAGYSTLAGRAPQTWVPVYVASGLYAGVTTLAQVIIVVYLLLKGSQSTTE